MTLTAVSPYAPTGRNTFFRHHKGIDASRNALILRRSVYVATLLVAIRFWKTPVWNRVCEQLRLGGHFNLFDPDDRRLLFDHARAQWTEKGVNFQELVRRVLSSTLARLKSLTSRLHPLSDIASSDSRTTATEALVNQKANGSAQGEAEIIRRNRRLIESILKYWFGQHSPEISQKKLWMIAASEHENRRRVDQEIAEQFEGIVCDLANSKECGIWNDWCHDCEVYGYEGKLAAIVALDQFSRHIRRYHNGQTGSTGLSFPSQDKLDALAYKTAEAFALHHKTEIGCGIIPTPMYVFALMPYRHTSTIESVQQVRDAIERTAVREVQMDVLIRRFRKATNRRMAALQDEARRTGDAESEHHRADNSIPDADILEALPFEADMSKAQTHVVHKTIESFLNERGISGRSLTERAGSVTDTTCVVVSLSGGVDSMVIASVLAHLSSNCSYNLHVVAVHIDYANRPESETEADYVRRYCASLGVEYTCRRIDEVTRGITARDEYERIAREVRYRTYRDTVDECRSLFQDSTAIIGVMLGHHRGDLRENVLSNSHKGCGPLDLSGMTSVSRNDGVVIYRPLLPLEKKDIFDYAHMYGVPYFKDTTPHWSTRGKLRGKLLPLLEEIYGEGSMNNLSTLATESDNARELLMQSVLNPFLDKVERKPMGIAFHTAPWRGQGIFFWKFVLREALHRSGLGMFSDKSVISFLERIDNDRLKSGWLQCRRDYAVYLGEDGKVLVFFPDSFPFRRADQFDCWGTAVQFGVENAATVGPWTIHAELVETAAMMPSEVEALVEQKAVASMDDLMAGYLHYYLRVSSEIPGHSRPLVFVHEFKRATRPRAWKRADLKVQSVLPLLGSEEETAHDTSDVSDWVVAKVTLRRN